MLRSADPTTEVPEFEALKQNINEEATHGALRIAGLVCLDSPLISQCGTVYREKILCVLKAGVLTNNGYLRLDPNALHYGIYAAGESPTPSFYQPCYCFHSSTFSISLIFFVYLYLTLSLTNVISPHPLSAPENQKMKHAHRPLARACRPTRSPKLHRRTEAVR